MKALIVDDKHENLYLLETILKGNGFLVTSAVDGAIALEKAKNETPDLIIADILMPVMDGFSFCREIKKDKVLANVPFIFYTATYTDPKDEKFALGLGADRFVVKPKDPDDLMQIIEEVLAESKSKSEVFKVEDSKPEEVVLKEYSEILVRKLEDKMTQLEESERELKWKNIQLRKEIDLFEQAEAEIKITIKALSESEERYRSVLQSAIDAIITFNAEGKIIEWNQGAETIFGYHKKEINGKSLDKIIPKNYFELNIDGITTYSIKNFERVIGKMAELSGIRKDGTEFPLELSLAKWETESGTFFTSIIRDISIRKNSEKKMRMLAHSIESIMECISITNSDDIIIFVNDAFVNTYGYSKEELIGKHIGIVRPKFAIALKSFAEILPQTLEGGWKGEIINQKKDGTLFPVYLSTSVVKDDEARPIALIGVATDVTDLYKSRDELVQAKEKAERADNLKSEFLAQMSHEIRTPINVILGNIEIVRESSDETVDSETKESFLSIEQASKRIIRTMDLILSAAELHSGNYKPNFIQINLHSKILCGLFESYRLPAEGKGIEFIYTHLFEDEFILADEYSVMQIFSNLIDNAVKYTFEGKIEIVLGKTDDERIFVEVKDTGIGMGEDFLKNIFTPFSQEDHGYSRTFDGNGLGLANVKKYCDLNYATLEFESSKNAGSSFKVIFRR